jgi:hypothetical protein
MSLGIDPAIHTHS